jgi:hypothetical protein
VNLARGTVREKDTNPAMSLQKDALQNRGVDLNRLLDDMIQGRVGKIQFAREALYSVMGLTHLPDSTVGSTSYAMWNDIADLAKQTIASGQITEDAFVQTYERATSGRMVNPVRATSGQVNAPSGNGGKRHDMPAGAGQAAASQGANRPARPPVSPNIVEAVKEVFTKVEDGNVPVTPQNAYVMFWETLPGEVKTGYTTTVIADTLKALFATDFNKAAGIIATLPEDARVGLLDTIGKQAPDSLQDNLKTAVTAAYHLDGNKVAGFLSGWEQGVQRLVEAKGADGGFDWEPSDDDKAEALVTHVKGFLRTLGRVLSEEVKAAEAARIANGGPPSGLQPVLWDTAKEFFPEAVRPFVGRTWANLPVEVQHAQIAEARAAAEVEAKASTEAAEAEATEVADEAAAATVEAEADKAEDKPKTNRRGSGTAS